MATALHRNSSYTNRWTLCEIANAISWTDAHSSNVATHAQFTNLAAHQAIINSGYNTPASRGDFIAWDRIHPSGSGACTFLCKRHQGILPDGSSAASGSSAYQAIVSNHINSVTSSNVVLVVLPDTNRSPRLTRNPTNQTVVAGSSTLFVAEALGAAPLSYQWRQGETNLAMHIT